MHRSLKAFSIIGLITLASVPVAAETSRGDARASNESRVLRTQPARQVTVPEVSGRPVSFLRYDPAQVRRTEVAALRRNECNSLLCGSRFLLLGVGF